MSNGCAPVLASYSAINLFTSSMSTVAGSYSRSVVSPWDENVRILDFMFGLLWDVPFGFLWESSRQVWVPEGHIAPFPTVVKMASRGAMRIASRFMGKLLVVLEIRIGISRVSRIEVSKMYRPFP